LGDHPHPEHPPARGGARAEPLTRAAGPWGVGPGRGTPAASLAPRMAAQGDAGTRDGDREDAGEKGEQEPRATLGTRRGC